MHMDAAYQSQFKIITNYKMKWNSAKSRIIYQFMSALSTRFQISDEKVIYILIGVLLTVYG